ncbi:MAG: radical SAM protein [Deltaproteobacteria bacterium]|nr:radical SAM protein [Deltaproteobacteria bacterium]
MKKYMRRNYLRRSGKILKDVMVKGTYDFDYDLMPMRTPPMTMKKRLNLIKSGINVFYRRPKPWSWPIHMQVELTNYCNLRCRVCPTGTGLLERPKGNLDVDMYARFMKEVGPYLLTASLWGWGEPLLHPRFSEIVDITRRHVVIPLLSTNGQNLNNDRVIEGLLKAPPTYLIVAIDGLTRETHAGYRRGADLNRILEGVHRLAEQKRVRKQRFPILNMRFIPMKHNEHEMKNIRQFAVENGFDYLTIRSLIVKEDLEAPHDKLIPKDKALRAYDYRDRRRIRRSDFICQLAFAFPAIRVDGSVVPCDQDYNGRQTYGRVGNGVSFADIWWSEAGARVRRVIRGNREIFGACRTCPYADQLSNAVTVDSYDLTGGLGYPSTAPNCRKQ